MKPSITKKLNYPNNLILTVVYAEWRRAIMLNVIMLSVVAPHSSPDDFQNDQNRNKEKQPFGKKSNYKK
jgi:hypothetical protein